MIGVPDGSGGGGRGTAPLWTKISSFSCSFRENWPNNRLTPLSGVGAPSWIYKTVKKTVIKLMPVISSKYCQNNTVQNLLVSEKGLMAWLTVDITFITRTHSSFYHDFRQISSTNEFNKINVSKSRKASPVIEPIAGNCSNHYLYYTVN